MLNIVHNMADELGVSNHITLRGGVCQYVRRVLEDLRAAFPFARVQKSLATRDERKARAAALDLDRIWDQRFAEARRARGLIVVTDGPAPLGTDEWSWPDWQALATWFGASLAEEDWTCFSSVALRHFVWVKEPEARDGVGGRSRPDRTSVA